MSNIVCRHVLDAMPFELDESSKGPIFFDNLLEELIHHYRNNSLYRKFCYKQNFNPNSYNGDLAGIPPIPVYVFKALGHKLSSVNSKSITGKLQSSATSGKPSTILIDKITSRRQTRAMARTISEVLGSKRQPFCVMDIDPSSANSGNLGARLAAISGYLNFASSASYFVDAAEKDGPLKFLDTKFVEYMNALDKSVPIVIFGFTFVLYHTVLKSLGKGDANFKLPVGSKIIHIGGWKKLESLKVDKEIFNEDMSRFFGISKKDVVDIYGFTEQMGLNYPDCKSGWKHVPAYSEVLIRNETDLSVCPDGTIGLLEFLSPLQHSYPGNVVLTDDLGVSRGGLCDCGYNGRRFKVIGRAQKAEVRGCGDVMSEKVAKQTAKSNFLDVQEKVDFLLSPIAINVQESPIKNLARIFTSLEKNQEWLSDQPSEAIIGLIDAARKTWPKNVGLDQYRDVGLNFLYSWCEPSRLSSLLDAGLNGQRGHLDAFIPRKDISGSSLKAVPRGVVCHWLSGNVPLLGMFALIQSILSKNTNVVKVSAGESQALPLILESFRGLKYTTPGGFTISGNELLETIAVVYFDRNQQEIAELFSSRADVRIAWGGREAVEAIATLPRRFTSQDVLFGPKLSMMVIGNDALSSDKAIRKLVRRAATDSSVFDQFACASPHTIFVEKGGKVSPSEFANLLAAAMEKALVRLPSNPPDVGQTNNIRSKIAEYGFIGDAWFDKYLRWTVLYSEGAELVDPTYQRVITVKGVDDIFDIVDAVNEDIQTVGLALSGERRLSFATKVTQKGALRCPDIGYMTHFDSPWDGVFLLHRLVKWVSLGGPL